MFSRDLKIIIIIAVAVIGLGFVLFMLDGGFDNRQSLPLDAAAPSDWTKGGESAKTVLIEYSDFQCPACAAYSSIIKQLNEEFGGKVVFVYRHFPLSQHQNAELAAVSAEAAGKQGKFWEMHDMLFENQDNWSNVGASEARELFIGYAGSVGLDAERFEKDLDLKELKEKVGNDLASGRKSGVSATPTFFLNGKKILPKSYEEFKKIISEI